MQSSGPSQATGGSVVAVGSHVVVPSVVVVSVVAVVDVIVVFDVIVAFDVIVVLVVVGSLEFVVAVAPSVGSAVLASLAESVINVATSDAESSAAVTISYFSWHPPASTSVTPPEIQPLRSQVIDMGASVRRSPPSGDRAPRAGCARRPSGVRWPRSHGRTSPRPLCRRRLSGQAARMIDLGMWIRALRIIPRLSKDEWERLDVVSRWLVATRAAVFVMTVVSAGIGGLLAARDGHFHGAHFLACLIGLVFAHATNNLVNDLTDHLQGVDKGNYFRAQYGPQPLEHGLMSVRDVLRYTAITGAVALAAGVYLVAATGTTALGLLLAGVAFVLFYTWPLKHIGLGEPTVLLVWGPLMVGGTYLVTAGQWSWDAALIGTAYALGPTAVLFGKHTDKLDADRAKGIFTLPVLLGEALSRRCVVAMLWAQLAAVVALVASGSLGWPLLVVLLAVPLLRQTAAVFARPRPDTCPPGFPSTIWPTYLVAYAFRYNRRFGLLFLAGLLTSLALG